MPAVEPIKPHWLNPESFSGLQPSEHETQWLRLLHSWPDLFLSKPIPKDKPSAKTMQDQQNKIDPSLGFGSV